MAIASACRLLPPDAGKTMLARPLGIGAPAGKIEKIRADYSSP